MRDWRSGGGTLRYAIHVDAIVVDSNVNQQMDAGDLQLNIAKGIAAFVSGIDYRAADRPP